MTGSKTIRLEKTLLLVWFLINLTIGALTVHEYGMSIDETNNQRYAADTLDAYPSLFGLLYEPKYDSSYDGHGPSFVTIAAIFIRIIQAIFPNVFAPDLWHYSYFIAFQLTGLCLYWLTRRWFNTWTAWAILLLFSTQPLLLGHAFINPKDTPFMFFLTLSVLWGFRMADAVSAKQAYVSLEGPARILADKFQTANPLRRRKFLIYFALALTGTFALTVFSSPVHALIEQTVVSFYNAEPASWAGRIFSSVARSNVPPEDYVTKALRLFQRLERGVLIAGMLFFLAYFGLLINNTTLAKFLRGSWAQRDRLREFSAHLADSLQGSLNTRPLNGWFAEVFRALRSPPVILAGIALGLATGVRAVGPLAGVIVFFYLLAKVRSRAWATATAYFLIAGIVTYITWPRLWDAPIKRYLEALGIASNFSHFPGRVLFNGQLYGASELPSSYLPVLLNIQFTETAIVCIYVGLGLLIWRLLRSRIRTDLLLYVGLGFVLPLCVLILLNSPLYHNFRQALFLIPALFIIAAFALELLLNKISQNWVRVLLIAALAFPGIYATAKLYPYEYVYYNSLVGGSAGAADRYELDYWRISLREMALELNKVAAPESLIVVTRSAGLLARYTRPDLIVDKPINSILDLEHGYDYLVHVARGEGGDLYPEVESLITIERDGTVLVTAKYVRGISGK
jgi:4-amino-4-deoxy-L-arabinose transferase-like glycosyltransferase